MQAVVTAGAGFLLAVLWFDLMFDVQARPRGDAEVPEPALASIAAYYGRVTTGARPMNRLVAAVMFATLAAIAAQLIDGDVSRGASAASAVAAVVPIGLAGGRTVPAAVRLGTRRDPVATQSLLARSILRDHLLCLASITALLVLQLAWG